MRQPFDSELGAFVEEICADLRVEAPGTAAFFVENKLAYTSAELVDRLRRAEQDA